MKNSKPLAVVVDDQESLRVILRSFLEVNGFRVLTAASGRDALRLCGRIKESIEVLITDVQMPGISGFDLAIKASQLRPGIPVLFMSGTSRESDSELRQRLGPHTAFIAKPFSSIALASKLRWVLRSSYPAAEFSW